jgi:hypothetical protein
MWPYVEPAQHGLIMMKVERMTLGRSVKLLHRLHRAQERDPRLMNMSMVFRDLDLKSLAGL